MIRRVFGPLLLVIPVIFLLLVADLGRPTFPSFATSASITLSLSYGPPTSAVVVSGKGFKGSEKVTFTFDTTATESTTASKTGTFTYTITVPRSAQPGNHVVQGKGNSSGSTAQATFLVQTDWVQQGFNRDHIGFNVFENVLTTGNVSTLTSTWSYNSDYAGGMVAVAHGIIYFGCDQSYLCALSATTGDSLWYYDTTEQVTATPAVANSLVYVSTAGGHVDALNATSGKLVWRYTTGFTITDAPLIANGLIYVGVSNGILYAFNGTTGQVVWKHTFPSIFSTPSIDNGLLYVSAGGSLYALKSQTGQIIWHVSAKGGTPVVGNGMIYLSDTSDDKLFALNEQTGVLIWSDVYPNVPPSPGDPSLANGVVYVIGDCILDARSATTGKLLWEYNGLGSGYCVTGTPAIANGVVYAAEEDSYFNPVYMFSAATGALVSKLGGYANGSHSPIVVNGTLYYSDELGAYAYSLPSTAAK